MPTSAHDKSEQPAPRWISVSERLPREFLVVFAWELHWKRPQLAKLENGIWIGLYHEEFDGALPSQDPTHWMPLPEPPLATPRAEPPREEDK